MNRKATPLTALVAAAAVAVVPVSGAVAATSAPAISGVSTAAATPAAVLKNIAAAPAGANTAAAAVPAALGTFVVVTDEAVQGATTGAQAVKADAAAIELPTVPQSVTDVLNTAGLPVQAVYRVLQTSQGVYTIWYKMLTSVPQAVFKGEFGSVPTLFQTAISDSLTWIATGAGPKVPETPKATAVVADAAESVAADAPNPLTAALDVAGIPVAAAYAAGQAGLSIYKNFYGLLTSVPRAIFQGKFGDAANLVVDSFAKSITTIVDFPGAQVKVASDKIDKLIAALNPTASAPTVTSTDVQGVSLASSEAAESSTAVVAAEKVTENAPAAASRPAAASKTADTPAAETSAPVTKPVAETTAVETSKPEAKPTAEKPATAEPTAEKPVESKPTVEKTAESKPSAAEKTAESKPSVAEKTAESQSAVEKPATSEATAEVASGADSGSSAK